jgi:hypothetical protein
VNRSAVTRSAIRTVAPGPIWRHIDRAWATSPCSVRVNIIPEEVSTVGTRITVTPAIAVAAASAGP